MIQATATETNFKKLYAKVTELEERNNTLQAQSTAKLTEIQMQMQTLLAKKK